MIRIACQIDNIRWNVDDSIHNGDTYEEACEKLGLPHFVPRMTVSVYGDASLKEIKNQIIVDLTKSHHAEAIDVDISEIFKR